jgi:WD40 repeat protein
MMPVRAPAFAQLPDLKQRRAAMLAGAALAAALLIGVLFWQEGKPPQPNPQTSISPTPASTPIEAPPSKQEALATPAPQPKPAKPTPSEQEALVIPPQPPQPPQPAKPAPLKQEASAIPAPPPEPAKSTVLPTVQPPIQTPPIVTPMTTSAQNPPVPQTPKAVAGTPPGSGSPAPSLLVPSLIRTVPVQPPTALVPVLHKLDKWAHCRPNSGPNINYIGGPLEQLTLKPMLADAKELRAIAISRDGTMLATAGDDRIVRIWDVASFRLLRLISGHTAEIYSVAFSRDGKYLASASLDGTVRIWDAQTFALIQKFDTNEGNGPVEQYAVEFDPSGIPRYVNSAGADGNVWIWDLQSPGHSYKWRDLAGGASLIRSLSFAPGGSGALVTAAYDGDIRFFTESRKIFAVPVTAGKLLHVQYSPDGSLVASAGVDSTKQVLKVWNVSNRTMFKAYEGRRNYANSVAWSQDSKTVALGEGGANPPAETWDVQSGKQLQTFTGHTKDIEAVAFHPNRKWLITASEDGMMKIWDLTSGKELLSVIGFANGQYLAYAPNGCYTGSANAMNYVTYVAKDAQGHERDTQKNGSDTMFVPNDLAGVLLPQ